MQKIPVIFILGSGHCGSTLLDMLLGTHPDIFGGGEVENVNPSLDCACGRSMKDCSVWSAVPAYQEGQLKVARSKKDTLLRKKKYYNLYGSFDEKRFVDDNIALYKGMLEGGKKKIIVDSSKNPDRVRLLAESPHIDARVVHLVRGGRANTWSYIRKYNKVFPFFFWWILTNIKIELLRYEIRLPWKRIHYNRLVENPSRLLEELAVWVGVSNTFTIDAFRDVTHHQITGNRMRKGGSNTIKRDTGWKKEMPYWQQLVFIVLFGWLDIYYTVRS